MHGYQCVYRYMYSYMYSDMCMYERPGSVLSSTPAFQSHSLMVPSPDPVASSSGWSGERWNATELTAPVCPLSVLSSVLARQSHSLTPPSRHPEASSAVDVDGWNATAVAEHRPPPPPPLPPAEVLQRTR